MESESQRFNSDIAGNVEGFLGYEGAQELLKQAAEEAGFVVSRVTKVPKGGNNGIFVLEDAQGRKMIAKFYQRDHRTRLEREYLANTFLYAHGFPVAQPLLKNDERNYGVFSFEDGQHVDAINA